MESQNPNRPWIILLWVVLISILVGVFYFWLKLLYCNNNLHCVFTRWDREVRKEFEENRMKELNKNNEQEQSTIEENKETEESKETINQEEINKETRIANPASENCVSQWGESYVEKDQDWNEIGFCKLKNGLIIEEWELFYDDQKQSKVDEQENIENPQTPVLSDEKINDLPTVEDLIVDSTNHKQSSINKYLGLTKEQAKQLADKEWVDFRIVKEDWEFYFITKEYNSSRINVEVENWVVVDVFLG